jgi:tetratricopeptide (TPR) repeat protein
MARSAGNRTQAIHIAEAQVSPSEKATFRHGRWVAAGIFSLALLVRLAFLAEDSKSPFFPYRGIDAVDYHQMALGLTKGTWPGSEALFRPPLYPLFLGVLYATVGSSAATVKVVQAVLGSVSCLLVYLVARRFIDAQSVGVGAGVICCLCGPLIYFDGQLLPACLDVLLQLLVVYLLLGAAGRQSIVRWALAGGIIGLAAVNRGGILLLVPIVLFWMYAVLRRGWPVPGGPTHPSRSCSLWRNAAALLLAVGLVILPVALHNACYDTPPAASTDGLSTTTPANVVVKRLLTRRFVPVASNVGINFYLGNHWDLREINNTSHPQHFLHYERIMEEPKRQGLENASGQSRYLVNRTLQDIRARPIDFLRLMGLKFAQLFSGDEIPRNSNLYAHRQYSAVLSTLLWKNVIAFPSGLIIPLGLVGVIVGLPRWRGHFLLLATLTVQACFLLAFFITARYRAASLPLLAIYASLAVSVLARLARERAYARVAGVLVLSVILIVLCNCQIRPMDPRHAHYEYVYLGEALAEQGKLDEAVTRFEEALRLNPDSYGTHLNLASVFARQGKPEQAASQCLDALRINPYYAEAQSDLGDLMIQQGRLDEALSCYEQALRIKPDLVQAHFNLAAVLVRQGRADQAIEHYRQALRRKADLPEAHLGLADLLVGQGRLDEAIAHYSAALRWKPDYPEAHNNLGSALGRQQKIDQAMHHFSEALRLRPDYAEAHNNLGNALAIQGRLDQAIAHFSEAVRIDPGSVNARRNLEQALAQKAAGR